MSYAYKQSILFLTKYEVRNVKSIYLRYRCPSEFESQVRNLNKIDS